MSSGKETSVTRVIVICCVHDSDVFPDASIATYSRVIIVPAPQLSVSSVVSFISSIDAPPQLSVAEIPAPDAGTGCVQLIVWSLQVITGAALSSMMIEPQQ